ncbi:MAG TPA: DUF3617 family protein [Usitatibacter sp.]|nr:DUF3617 family protein [Usitatibacter sp.]
MQEVTAVRGLRLLAACGVAAMSCAVAAQQPDGKNLFKGRLKPGMYEFKTLTEMSGVTSSKQQEKSTETEKRCVTPAEVDKGVELRKDCKVTTFKETGTSFEVISQCPDGSVQEMRVAVTSSGFTSEVKAESKQKGKEHHMLMRSEARYLGACKG